MTENVYTPPPRLFARNDIGLIADGSVQYQYNADGSINWRKMIKPEYLVPHRQYFEKKHKPVPETIEGLEDNELLILLGGLKELAQLRGYKEVIIPPPTAGPDYVIAVCTIQWIPNYETENRPVTYSSIGDARPSNTTGFGKLYLGPIAENRAFVRCVRNFLKINIVSQEEVGAPSTESEDGSVSLLAETMKKYKISFETIKAKLVEEGVVEAAEYKTVEDIPRFKQFELLERINKKVAAKVA